MAINVLRNNRYGPGGRNPAPPPELIGNVQKAIKFSVERIKKSTRR